MSETPNVVIVMARCSRGEGSFGIRFEEKALGEWIGDWAFAMKEASAKREGYDRGEIRGGLAFEAGYPGCPHCESQGIFKCGCGKVACWDGESPTVTCPWCASSGELRGQIESLRAEADR